MRMIGMPQCPLSCRPYTLLHLPTIVSHSFWHLERDAQHELARAHVTHIVHGGGSLKGAAHDALDFGKHVCTFAQHGVPESKVKGVRNTVYQ